MVLFYITSNFWLKKVIQYYAPDLVPHDQVEIILLDKDTQQQIKSYEEMGKTIYLLLTLTFGQET